MNFSDGLKYGFNSLMTNKNVKIQDMIDTYQYLRTAGMARRNYANSWVVLGQKLKTMVCSQTDSMSSKFDTFISYLEQLEQSELRLADREIRSAEDFRDVFERYAVMFRTADDTIASKTKFRNVSAKMEKSRNSLEAAKSKSNTKPEKIAKKEAKVEKLMNEKKEALDKLIADYKAIIEVREKYNQFKLRRFSECFKTYGSSLRSEMEEQSQIYEKILKWFSDRREELSLTDEKIAEMEGALHDHIEDFKRQQTAAIAPIANINSETTENDTKEVKETTETKEEEEAKEPIKLEPPTPTINDAGDVKSDDENEFEKGHFDL